MALDPIFVKLSRRLRKDETPWEKKLWMHLKNRNFCGLKFKRQEVIGPYIYDFSCFEKKVIIELDGSEHKDPQRAEKDKIKEQYVKSLGYTVLRFNNNDIQNNLEGMLESIKTSIA